MNITHSKEPFVQATSASVNKPVDSIQTRLVDYACGLNYDALTPEAIRAAKVHIIDTLGALIGGFFGESCRIARNVAAQIPNPGGATVIGTRMKTTPEMAAFVNATTGRYAEMMDVYHWPGSSHGHPSDVVTPVLAASEYAKASGREFITGIVLAYEVFCRINDVFHNITSFDHTNFSCLGSAVAAGKVLGLARHQLSHCIAMAVVPNIILRQVRMGDSSMWKAVATGHAGKAGVFAALLARAGMEGPHLPFEGKAGWCDHVARERFSLHAMGGNGTVFKILHTGIKNRPAAGTTIPSILAAEKIAPIRSPRDITKVTVEVYKRAMEQGGTSLFGWANYQNLNSREAADHSIAYVVATTLLEGTVSLRSFNDAHLKSPELRALMQKIEVAENETFTQAFSRLPVEHRARVTVTTNNGERLVGESGGDQDDMAAAKSDAQVEEKFRGICEEVLSANRVTAILDRLWHLEASKSVAEVLPYFVIT